MSVEASPRATLSVGSTRRRGGRATRRGVLLGVLLCSAGVAACTDPDESSTPTTLTVPIAPTTTVRPDDGVLRIGALLPLSGPGAEFGQPMSDAVTFAVEQVNAASGFAGRDVEV